MDEVPQRRIRALLEIKRVDFIHNDLSNTAFYFKERIASKVAKGELDGVFLEMIAALTMTAFAFEAYLNFVGHHKIKDWDEWLSLKAKLKLILKELRLSVDHNKRPYVTIGKIIGIRNELAHGKPKLTETKKVEVGTHDELAEQLRSFQLEWEKTLTPDFVVEAYDDVEAIWRALLEAANIRVFETLSGGSSGIQFLSYAEDNETQ